MAGQKQNGSTVNATVSTTPGGLTSYLFSDPFSMQVNMGDVSGVAVVGSPTSDKIVLGTSSGNTISSSGGNDLFVVSQSATSLNGNVLHGGAGLDIVKISGSGANIDLTSAATGVASTGIEAVVGAKLLSGQSVNLTLSEFAASSLTNAAGGHAFVALIGGDGQVNLTAPKSATIIGVFNAAGQGYDASGNVLNDGGAALAALTPINSVAGTLAHLYSGSNTVSGQMAALGGLVGYVLQNGGQTYTVWTDGTLNMTSTDGTTTTTPSRPAATKDLGFIQAGTVPTFNSADAGYVTLGMAPSGSTELNLGTSTNGSTGAIALRAHPSGTIVHGGQGVNGGDYFDLSGSGGGNTLWGTPNGDLFELGQTSLQDVLHGQGGFNVVHAGGAGADVDLTSATTGTAASGIQAVVGSSAGRTETVELNLNNLGYSLNALGNKTSVFEMLGSSADTLTLSGNTWVASGLAFSSTGVLPQNATALTGASTLDAVYNGNANSGVAESSLTGQLYELLGSGGAVLRYATVWTNATVVTSFKPLKAAALMTQAMAQLPAATSALAAPLATAAPGPALTGLAAGHALSVRA